LAKPHQIRLGVSSIDLSFKNSMCEWPKVLVDAVVTSKGSA